MYQKIKTILQEYACVVGGLITPQSNLQKDLFLNSLDIVNVIVEFEKEFNIEIDEEDIHLFATVADITTYVEQKMALGEVCRA